MAQTRKKTTGKRASGNKQQNKSRRSSSAGKVSSRKKPASSTGLFGDVMLLTVLVVSVILLMSALGFGGLVGSSISQVMFGVMGYMFYAFPVILFVLMIILMSRRLYGRRFRKALSCLLLFVLLCGFLQAVTDGVIPGNTIPDYYDNSSLYHSGGGLIGGAVFSSLAMAFGETGGLIILILAIILCVIELTQESIFGFLFSIGDGIGRMVENGREQYARGEPERELRREIRDTKRQQLREERREARIQELEKRKAALHEPLYDSDYDEDPEDYEDDYLPGGDIFDEDEDSYEEGPVIGDIRTPARRKNPKIDSFPGKKPELDIPIFEDQNDIPESRDMKKARKAIRKQQSRGSRFLDGTLLKEENLEASEDSPDMRELNEQLSIFRGEDSSFHEEEFSFHEKEPAFRGEEFSARGEESSVRREEDGYPEDFRESDEEDLPKEKLPPVARRKRRPKTAVSGDELMKEAYDAPEEIPVKHKTGKQGKSSGEEIEEGVSSIENQISENEEPPRKDYKFPPLRLLKKGSGKSQGDSDAYLRATARKLQDTLYNFGVNATVSNVSCGPTVTRFELTPEMGVKVSKIVGLADDIKLNLACADIRIEAPIPGKSAVGIEVPNKENTPVMLRDLLESDEFQNASSKTSFAVGKDIAGKPVVTDIAKMPHVLIAGATGSGKSVCINTLIMSILYKASPDEVKLIMIDPKVVELSVYNGIPHLFIPVVTDPKKAAGALNWAVSEMSSRYNTFAEYSVRNLKEYNNKVKNLRLAEQDARPPQMPQIIIIVDELADLMMVAPGDVEDAICRLAQLARAAGIHLVIATQRPSVNVITGLIKANMPSRIAFSVASGVDSRTILDMNGAEKLLGKGDMLFYPQGYQKPARLQGAFVSDEEVSAVVEFLSSKNPKTEYDSGIQKQMDSAVPGGSFSASGEDRDAYFAEAGRFIIEKDKASIGMLQRMFKIGFNRAARIMDQLAEAGVVGPEEGTKPRKILMSMEEFESYLEEN